MSNTLSLVGLAWSRRRNTSGSSASLPPLSTWSGTHTAHSVLSSPPPHSSSPPRTPFSSAAHGYPDIQSSPTSETEAFHRHAFGLTDELSPFWKPHQAPFPSKNPKQMNSMLSSFNSSFPDSISRQSMPFPSLPRFLSFHQKLLDDPYPHYSPVFYDSEEDGGDDEEGYSFVEEDVRTTFFRTSAERGRWRYDPVPIKTELRSHLRQSAPTSSPCQIQGFHRSVRPGSEPALSTSRLSPPVEARELYVDQADTSPYCAENAVIDPPSPPCYHASLPSLTSDSEPDHCPSSPLPPSSPPLSSYSTPSSPMRPITPVSLAPISPPRASSPISDHHVEATAIEAAKDADGVSVLLCDSSETEGSADVPMDHLVKSDQDPAEDQRLTSFPLPLDTHHPTDLIITLEETPTAAIDALTPQSPSLVIPPIAEGILETPAPTAHDEIPIAQDSKVSWVEELMLDDSETLVASSLPSAGVEKEASDQQSDPEYTLASEGESSSGPANMKRKRRGGTGGGVPAGKKSRMTEPESAPPRRASLSKLSGHVESKSTRRQRKRSPEDDDDAPLDGGGSSSSTAKAKKKNAEGRRSLSQQGSSHSLPSTSKSRHTKVRHDKSLASPTCEKSRLNKPTSRSKPTAHEPEPPLDPETRALLTEIRGMLIECMATSRASCLPISSLYKSVMECRPSLKAQRSEEEWIKVFQKALRSGEAGRGSGVFGKVESSFKDESNRALEAQWFYVPENDEDQERATLLKTMMPRPGKRTETKKYKQYYYRPLEKISRWDPEDEM